MSSWLVGPVALAGVVVLERLGKKLTGSRAKGWIGGYLLIGLAALALAPRALTSSALDWRASWLRSKSCCGGRWSALK
jgi:hypothetical protein